MTDYEKKIAYDEGFLDYCQDVNAVDNPYEGVSETLAKSWNDGWWDAFDEE